MVKPFSGQLIRNCAFPRFKEGFKLLSTICLLHTLLKVKFFFFLPKLVGKILTKIKNQKTILQPRHHVK